MEKFKLKRRTIMYDGELIKKLRVNKKLTQSQ
ncbi:transcriptional regulator, partial [Enterococcus faecium]|nr:transcriptional regulator [Enterococcus faecium]